MRNSHARPRAQWELHVFAELHQMGCAGQSRVRCTNARHVLCFCTELTREEIGIYTILHDVRDSAIMERHERNSHAQARPPMA